MKGVDFLVQDGSIVQQRALFASANSQEFQ